ncbi:synapse-associated protein 1, partial [Latimeria chalumnae]|uniref:synapse-associated protein 1 n=1 Tax=Latimeria chalumnae TaxID=7897 RepID=UPI00313AB79F
TRRNNWLGGGSSTDTKTEDEGERGEQPPAGSPEGAAHVEEKQGQAKGIGNFLLGVAVSATRKVSESVWETAQTIKKSVDENPIDNIIDKTILGDFKKEQEKFVKEQKSRKTDTAVPPWVGYSEEEIIKQQILALSSDRRNFLRDPPAGVHFHFDFSHIAPVAMVMLQEDELLDKMRFELVPKLVKEEAFWRNYFYRISLIKQSAQLSSLAAQQVSHPRDTAQRDQKSLSNTDSPLSKTPPIAVKRKGNTSEAPGAEEVSTSPAGSEFVSDAYDTSVLNQEDLLKEMEQLGMSGKAELLQLEDDDGDIPEWEKELQRELQEFEVVEEEEKNKVSEAWEKEIELMLQSDD